MLRREFLAGMVAGGAVAGIPGSPTAAARNFVSWECMKWNNRPASLQACGLRNMPIFYQSALVTDKDPDFNKIDKVVAQIRSSKPALVTLDIERWYPSYSGGRSRLIAVVDYLRARIPASTKLGYWGIMPTANYADYLAGGSRLAEQRALNKAMRPLAAKVDWIMPSLYASEANPQRWAAYARIVLEEARLFGKPVMPWLWMQYLETSPARSIRYQPIPGSFFRQQLETAWNQGDSLCLWGTVQPPASNPIRRLNWNDNAAWWLETKSFLRSHGSNISACKS